MPKVMQSHFGLFSLPDYLGERLVGAEGDTGWDVLGADPKANRGLLAIVA